MSKYTLRHIPPRDRVLLVSCMDLRLLDNLVSFMAADNLTNRYDQFIMAGAGLAAGVPQLDYWLKTLFDHLDIAYTLHTVRDVYIIEHRNCGAYKEYKQLVYDDSKTDQAKEWKDHYTYSQKLKQLIEKEAKTLVETKGENGKTVKTPRWANLRVQCFMMDLRGGIKMLDTNKEKAD